MFRGCCRGAKGWGGLECGNQEVSMVSFPYCVFPARWSVPIVMTTYAEKAYSYSIVWKLKTKIYTAINITVSWDVTLCRFIDIGVSAESVTSFFMEQNYSFTQWCLNNKHDWLLCWALSIALGLPFRKLDLIPHHVEWRNSRSWNKERSSKHVTFEVLSLVTTKSLSSEVWYRVVW
jgi:hypothetical protein